jgi:hypothetical protein
MFFSYFKNTGRWTKSKNPVFSTVIHYRQNSSESTLVLWLWILVLIATRKLEGRLAKDVRAAFGMKYPQPIFS